MSKHQTTIKHPSKVQAKRTKLLLEAVKSGDCGQRAITAALRRNLKRSTIHAE